ncbi:MAG: hypothetical protein IJQ42_02940 [Oscillospiraceae bacterium]|nr:hypothetical protein [Oscillospiraceae bacterium]
MKPKINPFWGFLTLGLLLLSFVLCVVGAKHGVLMLKTDARPEDTVETFFESVVIGKYEEANACLENYSSLGLERISDNAKWNALLASYDFALEGEAERKGDTAVQTVRLRYLDLAALEQTLATPLAVIPAANEGEEDRAIYYTQEELLAHPESFYTSAMLEVTLHYVDGQWLIYADDSLLSALAGGK